MNIDQAIRLFAKFLDNTWEIVLPSLKNRPYASDDDTSIHDWLQANWELLVELKVLDTDGHLEIYGSGADLNGASSRIVYPDAVGTFKVIAKPKSGDTVLDVLRNEQVTISNLTFDELASFNNVFYEFKPPFNFALLTEAGGELPRVVSLGDIEFELLRM